MTPEERNDLIASYAAGYEEVAQALNGFPAESLGARPIPGRIFMVPSGAVSMPMLWTLR